MTCRTCRASLTWQSRKLGLHNCHECRRNAKAHMRRMEEKFVGSIVGQAMAAIITLEARQ